MRIAVIAYNLRVAGGLSVGQNIIQTLARVGDRHEYLFLLPARAGYEHLDMPRRSQCRYLSAKPLLRQAWHDAAVLPRQIDHFDPDLVWGLGNIGTYGRRRPQALLIHNPHRFYPARHAGRIGPVKRIERVLRGWQLKILLGRIVLVFCQTETMRRRLIDQYRFQGRTALMPNAISKMTLAHSHSDEPDDMRPHRGKFRLLTLTKYYPHKNIEGLVSVFGRHREALRDVVVFMPIGAKQGRGARRIMQRIASEGLSANLVCTGAIAQQQLAGWFQHSDGLLFPTLVESFSGTYIEAMHFGLPIITSNLDFAHEVCGDAALYCNPWQTQSIKNAILELKGSQHLRDTLIANGKRRLDLFGNSWETIVAAALTELESLVGGSD